MFSIDQLLTNPMYGSRPNVPKVIILITDGKPTRDADILQNEVVIIKSLGIRIVTVGITNAVSLSNHNTTLHYTTSSFILTPRRGWVLKSLNDEAAAAADEA